jgi:Flp pilus assembly protein TadD
LLERLGRYPEALSEAQAARNTVTNTPYFLMQIGFVYARSGDVTNAQKILAELEGWKKRGYAVRTDMAQVHVGLREFGPALDEFEAAYANGESLTDFLVDPTLDEARQLPRFQALLEKLGLKK